ncbi:MAG: 2-amino-4-hydroxy-6-hydroxymethyldihydropteridine diphosphokinase [Chitinophagia bacterium]|nr:2-amino-4-hydroxy-6-hydroxymethyldihydropteridine diphosphokinase [Chitinophagia bacterium]
MNSTYLLLGSNMGNSTELLSNAIEQIENKIGPLLLQSNLYATAAWGNTSQPDFLNQVIEVATQLDATETLKEILSIEKNMGRIRTVKNAPRIIDIDILFFNNEIINRIDLIVPHPEIQNRRFVLIPLNEIVPQMIHPVLNKTIDQLLSFCPDQLAVKKI